MTGVFAYVSAPIWFLFLALSTLLLAVHTLGIPQYFVEPFQLFPRWPEWRAEWAVALFGATASLLFLPKLLAVALVLLKGPGRFGGHLRLVSSMLAEMALSALLAPIRMLFHTQFVLGAIFGRAAQWKSPPREDAETGWREAWERHGLHTLLGLAWAALVYWLNPAFLGWLAPVAGALALSIPISVLSSRVALGRRARAARLFLIPEESWPPIELRWTRMGVKRAPAVPDFVDAVIDADINTLVCGTTRGRPGSAAHLVREALVKGIDGLSAQQKSALLNDPVSLAQLHRAVYGAAREGAAPPSFQQRSASL